LDVVDPDTLEEGSRKGNSFDELENQYTRE
jgi:hypothetical protein